MKKYLILLLIPLLLHSCGTASKISKADQPWSYETEREAKKNAVHAVIFRGIPAGNGATAQPALRTGELTPAESAFFDTFFQSEYQRYISSVASGSIQVIKTGRNEYKIGYVISVSKDNLRKYLEDQGIVKGLSSGF